MLPRTLYGRAFLIVVMPLILVQISVGGVFTDRVFNRTTNEMSRVYARIINQRIDQLTKARGSPSEEGMLQAAYLGMTIQPHDPNAQKPRDHRRPFDLTGLYINRALHQYVRDLRSVDLGTRANDQITLIIGNEEFAYSVSFDRSYVSTRNPHQLLVFMIFVSSLLILVAALALRNQVTPIRRLSQAASAFGRGVNLPLKPRGAKEVREAATAFIEMRNRIERHIQQRTLMLSGVSHDLRTPLTRMKLALSLIDESKEIISLRNDILEMEGVIDEFITFSQTASVESPRFTSLTELINQRVENARPLGGTIDVNFNGVEQDATINCRPTAIGRVFDNILSNARKYGTHTLVTVSKEAHQFVIRIEDNGKGIPDADLARVLEPFERLDDARTRDEHGGSGLGLSITADIIRHHGGHLELGVSEALGGLSVSISLPMEGVKNIETL